MLKISVAQRQAMSSLMAEEFARRMTTHLQKLFPDQLRALDSQNLLKHVLSAMARAFSYGVVREGDMQRYLEYAALYGWEFDLATETSWARPILEDGSLDGSAKMDALDRYQAALPGEASSVAPTDRSEESND